MAGDNRVKSLSSVFENINSEQAEGAFKSMAETVRKRNKEFDKSQEKKRIEVSRSPSTVTPSLPYVNLQSNTFSSGLI